jgi:hypothetical protein
MLLRLKALENAVRYLGVTEQPLGSNRGALVDRWLRNAGAGVPNPWCAAFAYSMLLKAGRKLSIKYPASVRSWLDYGRSGSYLVMRPFKGDYALYETGTDHAYDDHIGQVVKVLALRPFNRYWIKTIEGNSHNRVEYRWRWVDPSNVKFMRVPGQAPLS